jgi:hypothetical protein
MSAETTRMGPAPRVDREEFAKLNAEGWTLPQLAEHFSIHVTYASRLRTKLGIKSPNRLNLSPERLATIEAMLDDGMSFKEIHRTEGADMETLRNHFPGRGWTIQEACEYRAALRELEPLIRRNNVARIKRYKK